EALARAGGRLVVAGDPEYPASLFDLPDPPAALFTRGLAIPNLGSTAAAAPPGATPAVAVVGSRTSSAGGREMAAVLGEALGERGCCVVSGAAIGIDAAAHRGALAAGGPTVAVLGSGIDVV